MRLPGIEMCVVVGGTGNLVLKAVTGTPTFGTVYSGVYGATNEFLTVEYVINDGNSMETGIGKVNLNNGVLTRTRVLTTWDGTTWDETTPSPLNVAAGASVVVSDTGWNQVPANTAGIIRTLTSGDDSGTAPMNVYLTSGASAMVADRVYYCANYWGIAGEIDQVALRVTIAGAASTIAKLAMYTVSTTGLPDQLIRYFGDVATDSTGTKKLSAFTSFFLNPGWYYMGIVCTGTPTLRVYTCGPGSPVGLNGGTDRNYVYRSLTAGTASSYSFPSTEANTLTMINSGTGVPLITLRTRN